MMSASKMGILVEHASKVYTIRGELWHALPKILEKTEARMALTAFSEFKNAIFLKLYCGIRTKLLWPWSGSKLQNFSQKPKHLLTAEF